MVVSTRTDTVTSTTTVFTATVPSTTATVTGFYGSGPQKIKRAEAAAPPKCMTNGVTYPASRITSACSCIDVPAQTVSVTYTAGTATVTDVSKKKQPGEPGGCFFVANGRLNRRSLPFSRPRPPQQSGRRYRPSPPPVLLPSLSPQPLSRTSTSNRATSTAGRTTTTTTPAGTAMSCQWLAPTASPPGCSA